MKQPAHDRKALIAEILAKTPKLATADLVLLLSSIKAALGPGK